MGRLEVRIMYARNLPNTQIIGVIDPYCVVSCEGRKYRTTTKKDDLNPEWDEKFVFMVADPASAQLRLKVRNYNKVKDDDIGKYYMGLAGLERGALTQYQFTLSGCKTGFIVVMVQAVDFGTPPRIQQRVPKPTPRARTPSPPPRQKYSELTFFPPNMEMPSLTLADHTDANGFTTIWVDTYGITDEDGVLNLDAYYIPSEGDALYFHGRKGDPDDTVVSIGHYFLRDVVVTSVDISGLTRLRKIGHSFLERGLLKVFSITTPMKVESIGDDFMRNCVKLTKVDLTGLSRVKRIDDNFLSDNTRLLSFTHNFQQVRTVGKGFLYRCKSLKSADLRPFHSVQTVGHDFFSGCHSLQAVDLSSLTKLSSCGDNFLKDCRSARVSGTSAVENASSGRNFMEGCSAHT